MIFRLLVGALMGAIIGFEREAHGRPAGFRTHLLVCLSGVLVMLISHEHYLFMAMNPAYMKADPGRIVSGAITGVGFLGAGVIVKARGSVTGLTTAACIWIVFAIGLAVGSGMYLPAVFVFVLTYFALWTLRLAERKISRLIYRHITIAADDILQEISVRSILNEHGNIMGIDYERNIGTREIVYKIQVALQGDSKIKEILDRLAELQGVKNIRIGVSL